MLHAKLKKAEPLSNAFILLRFRFIAIPREQVQADASLLPSSLLVHNLGSRHVVESTVLAEAARVGFDVASVTVDLISYLLAWACVFLLATQEAQSRSTALSRSDLSNDRCLLSFHSIHWNSNACPLRALVASWR